MKTKGKIRAIVTKVGLDGHDRGAKLLSYFLREAGMEVMYLGLFQTPEAIVSAAIQEDADVICVSSLSGGHLLYTPQIVSLLKENNLGHILFLFGGVFPVEDMPLLKQEGVNEVFLSMTPMEEIVRYIKENVGRSGRGQ